MNTDSEKAGAQAPCLLCGRAASEHSRDTADVCNCYLAGETDAHKRCAICGFVINTKYEATKPTVEYGSTGRAKITMKNDPALDTSVEALRRTINAQKVELASRNLRITGLEETLKETERFMSYFAGETGGHFVGDGTPTTCLARVRRILSAHGCGKS